MPEPEPVQQTLEQQRIAELEARLAAAEARAASLTNEALPPDPDQVRADVLTAFATLTKLPPINAITQRGRNPETARFTLHFNSGTDVRIGTINTLWSRAELSKVLLVAIQRAPAPCKPTDWTDAIAALFAHAVTVQETPEELFEETVRDWLGIYANTASTDPQAAANRKPFTRAGYLYVSATALATYVRREHSEQVKLHDLRTALTDIGFESTHVAYTRGAGDSKTRTSASYYRARVADVADRTPPTDETA